MSVVCTQNVIAMTTYHSKLLENNGLYDLVPTALSVSRPQLSTQGTSLLREAWRKSLSSYNCDPFVWISWQLDRAAKWCEDLVDQKSEHWCICMNQIEASSPNVPCVNKRIS
jgi:hypothetical protein